MNPAGLAFVPHLAPPLEGSLTALLDGPLVAVFSELVRLVAAVTVDPEPAHVVGTGGAIGAILRHLVYRRLPQDRPPVATLAVNVLGSFVFGAAVFAGAAEATIHLLGIGICGSFTTFSTFSAETVGLWERGDRRLAVGNAAANLFVSLAAIGLAWALVTAVG